ncbi:MAG TPA: MmcQ/YjbR family DNA-binding protein [Micromonosporaceae bacterium]|nr:MmcQ/YjbR family DNA-binding protein [Micromonosporaceae bacterium]
MGVSYEQVRDWVLGLPGGCEVMVEAWGHPTLRVGDKMFASGGPGLPTMSLKATREEQEILVTEQPETFSVAGYVGRFGWVEVQLSTVDEDELRDLVVQAWRRTAPKRLVKQYDAGRSR